MRWRLIAAILGFALSCSALLNADEPLPTSYLRQPIFTMPFNVAGDTVEVQLYVSIDRGVTWHLYSQQRPDAKKFRFRASQDGEFWFASRTVDRAGVGRPPTITRPERRVVIDTRPPRLTVQASATAAGEVQASWDIDDENLAPPTFRVGYRTDIATTWQLVTAPPLDPQGGKSAHGQVAWRPPAGSRVLQIHVEVADAAGNWAVQEKEVTLSSIAPAIPAAPQSPAISPTVPTTPAAPGSFASSVPTVPATGGQMASVPASNSPLGADRPAYSFNDSAKPNVIDERPRMTTSRRFVLDYDIESAGPGGIADVELWMTRDRGNTWLRYGTDPDKQSPVDVEVDADGMYGVRIVLVSGSGLATTAPRTGDPADLWVGVDTVQPTVQFSSISYGEGQHAGQLDIRWRADDQRFGPRPITLAYAESPTGPWTTIAAGLPNTGQHFWSADSFVPKKIVLRIEARDEAGNQATETLTEPIGLQGLSPARVKGVQPR